MVKLFCVIIGAEGSAFPVEIDENESVGDLKNEIQLESPKTIKYDANNFQLFLTKKNGAWLQSCSEDVKKLREGEKTAAIEELIHKNKELDPTKIIRDVFVDVPTQNTIHVSCVGGGSSSSRQGYTFGHELNEILDKNKKLKTSNESSFVVDEGSSTGDSSIQWSEVKSVLDYERYKQSRKPIPDRNLEFLAKYLKYASEAMKGYMDTPTNAIFIAPVLVMICSLFDDVKLEVEETVIGNEVHADGHFEFVLTRGKTKICIVEAKKNDFERGKAQLLVGCEAVADREGLFVVYGIVTDFFKWHLEKSIALDSSTLSVRSDELDMKLMRDVCEMIYSVLEDSKKDIPPIVPTKECKTDSNAVFYRSKRHSRSSLESLQ